MGSLPEVGLRDEPLLPHVGERSPRPHDRVAAAEPGLHLCTRQSCVAQTAVDAPPTDATVPVRVLDLVAARGWVSVDAALDTNAPYGLRLPLHRELGLLVPRPRA